MRPGTFHAPGLPSEMVRLIDNSVRGLKDPDKRGQAAPKKPRPFKRKGGLARKEDE